MQRAGAMSSLAFQGGTALRFLYGLPRYSEDLDFAMERRRRDRDPGRDLRGWLAASARQLRREGYDVAVSVRDRTVVHVGWVRLRGLLHEVGLSPHAEEVLGIRVEVDTRPPAGSVTEVRLVRRRVETLDWHAIVTDVRPFLGAGARMPEKEEVLALLEA